MNRWIYFFLLCTAGITVFSCRNIFAPELGNLSDEGGLYRSVMSSPQDVLSNFRYAYIYQDSLVYSNILDSAFIFIYYEPDDEGGSGQYVSWSRDIEMRATAGVFRTFSPIDLLWNTTLDSNYSYIKDGVLVRTEKGMFDSANFADMSKTFQLNLGTDLSIVGTAVFDFTRSQRDDQWRISRWLDDF